jgi:hypothetical protein
MPDSRRKLSAALRDFHAELSYLERFDAENQANFSASTGLPASQRLSKRQLHLLTESIFFAAFRAYENFVREVFLLYCLEKRPQSQKKVRSYLKPKSFHHAERLLQSSMRFLDWVDPNEIIRRAELYLEDGFPMKLPYTVNTDALRDFKRIRNHIAHQSPQSRDDYLKVLRKHYTVVPVTIPSPGEFLLESERSNPNMYKLLTFLQLMKTLSKDVT